MTITTITMHDHGHELTLRIEGGVDIAHDEFAGQLIDLARVAYASVFPDDFNEHVLDAFEHRFQARQEEAAEPSEYDQGWQAGHDAGTASAVIAAHEGSAVRPKAIVLEGFDPASGFREGAVVTVLTEEPMTHSDGKGWHLVTTDDGLANDASLKVGEHDPWEFGVTAWVKPEHLERIEETP